MPQVIQAAATFVTWLLTAQGTLAAIARFAATILLNVVLSKLFGPKVPDGVGLSGIQLTTRSTTEFRKVIYGQALVSGPVAYNNTSGPDNRDLWFVIPMCQGLSEDLVEVRVDKDVIPKADIDWAAGSGASDGTGTGEVTTAKFVGGGSPSEKALRIYYYLGDDLQPASGDLDAEFADITSAFRLRGVTHMIFRMRYNTALAKVWKEGVPRNLMALWKGRLVYDSRKDSTNGGSGTHRFADATTWEWSDNPALCVVDYLMTYMTVDPAVSIDWPAAAAAADDCDVLAEIPPAASPANTEKRFTCNGALSLGSTHRDNLDKLLSSMDGRLSYVGGQWKIRASVWEASSVSLGEDDLVGGIEVRGSAPRDDRFNTVRGFFVDPASDYQSIEFPLVTKAAYVTRDDGRVLDHELLLPFTNGSFMAQRIAFRLLEQGNNQVIAEVPLNARGAEAATGDVVDLTVGDLSWSAKTFRLVNWVRDASSVFNLSLREDNSASYDDPLVSEYSTVIGGVITPPADSVPPPTGLSATAVEFGIQLAWTNPAAETFETIEVYESDTDQWGAAAKVAEVVADTLTIPYSAAVQKWFWIRARKAEVLSAREPDSDTSTITATPIIPVQGPAVNLDGEVISSSVSGGSAKAGVRINQGGSVDKRDEDVYTQIDSPDWADPPEFAPGLYEVKADITGDALDGGSDATGTWLSLAAATREWFISQLSSGSKATDVTVRLRRDGGAELDNGLYDLDVDVTSVHQLSASNNDVYAADFSGTGQDPIAGWRANASGLAQSATGDTGGALSWITTFTSPDWLKPPDGGDADSYEIRATEVSQSGGAATRLGTMDTWLALTSTRFWTIQRTALTNGTSEWVIDFEIRTIGASPTDEVTGRVTLRATRSA